MSLNKSMQNEAKRLQMSLLQETGTPAGEVTEELVARLLAGIEAYAHRVTSEMLTQASAYVQEEGVLAELHEGLGEYAPSQPEQV